MGAGVLRPRKVKGGGLPGVFGGADLPGGGAYRGAAPQPVKNGPPGVAKRQQLRVFVISFARRVVARLSEPAVAKKRARHRNTGVFGVHFAKKRVASGNNQAHGRQFGNAPRLDRKSVV